MQRPTIDNLYIRDVADANKILHAVQLGLLQPITRRLDDEERHSLQSGCVYVWEQRSHDPTEITGQEIQRFTEGRSWGPSRARDDFLIYYEKEGGSRTSLANRHGGLAFGRFVKQTYSAYIHPNMGRKWHINAYFTQGDQDHLRRVEHIPWLQNLKVPDNVYFSSRTSHRARATGGPNQSPDSDDECNETMPGNLSIQPRSPYSEGSGSGSSRSAASTPQSSPCQFYSVPNHSPTYELKRPTWNLSQDEITSRQLAPLSYLENIAPRARNPMDDQALRSFRYNPRV
ncbi:Gti1/Pac2 family-domain-containing protein [Abortiporus biennis]|nr:Gti1/Pac2 family-domain-containing protein [Abortiporus biennis]